ncbi:uncharacterized protein FA14DRAFT_75401 [Meira miltonrushii]|uniref:SAGA-associated factor 11 n=1 Tax=Meira miltonrushii TaxID=1280837 RepID=A0A316V4S8_9BASI|nr:uncharacterized protein FA14DRAFT_75401 [Meira miltonrushii]PWN32557.1 hypothetical protein FA14DRAFT_75401 [Meira miltonrushii]
MPSRNARRSSTHQSSIAPEDGTSRSSVAPGGMLDDAKYTLASSLLATMMREVIIDHALMAHKNIIRLRKSQGKMQGGCTVCKTACQASPLDPAHTAKLTNGNAKEAPVKQEEENSTSNEASNTVQPKGLEIYHNNPLLSCIICSRQVSANRYAQHLASCVGVGKGGIARRKGKSTGNSKVKTALENRKRAGLLMSGASTPLQRATPVHDDGASVVSDDEFIKRSKSNLSHSFTKRSASPSVTDSSDPKKLRTEDGPSRAQSLLGASALAASQPATGSPLNPLRNTKTITIDSDEDEDDEDEEGAISMSQGQKSTNAPQSSSVLSGEEGSEFAGDDSGSEEDNESEDGSYHERPKGHHRSETASIQSEPEDDF